MQKTVRIDGFNYRCRLDPTPYENGYRVEIQDIDGTSCIGRVRATVDDALADALEFFRQLHPTEYRQAKMF